MSHCKIHYRNTYGNEDNNYFTPDSNCLPALSNSSTNNVNYDNGNSDVVSVAVDRIVFRVILKSMQEKKKERRKCGKIGRTRDINEYTKKKKSRKIKECRESDLYI